MRTALLFIVALAGPALCGGCGSAIADRVRAVARGGEVPADLTITYDDHHPTWGGERIVLSGDRSIRMSRWRPGDAQEDASVTGGTVSAQALAQTLSLLVEIEAWEQRAEPDDGRLDDARARLGIHVGSERSRVWEWRNDLEATRRLVRVKQALEALAFEAAHPMMGGRGATGGG